MEIIVLILMALGCLNSRDEFTPEYQNAHTYEVSKARNIYENNQYRLVDGGVIIDVGTNP